MKRIITIQFVIHTVTDRQANVYTFDTNAVLFLIGPDFGIHPGCFVPRVMLLEINPQINLAGQAISCTKVK